MGRASVRLGSRTNSLTQTTSVQDLVDHLSEAIGNPVTLEDTGFQLLAYSPHTGVADKARRLTILRRSVPAPIVKVLFDSGMMKQLNDSPRPVRLPGAAKVGLGSRVAMPIRVGSRVHGYIWVQETGRQLTDRDLRVLTRVAGLVALRLARISRDAQNRQRSEGDFLRDLILTASGDISHIRGVAQARGIDLPARYLVMTATLKGSSNELPDNEKSNAQGKLEELTLDITDFINTASSRLGLSALWTANQSELVTLIGTRDDVGVDESFTVVREILAFAREACDSKGFKISMGVSVLKATLTEIRDAYEEARRCQKVSQVLRGPSSALASPDSLGVLQFLSDLADSYPDPTRRRGIHAQVRRLLELHHRDSFAFPVVETLETYLDFGGNIVRAAQQLGIHPNSLNYRLRRISDATGLDFLDGIQRLAVHAELKVWRLRS